MRSPPLWPKGLRILLRSRPIWLPSSITTPRAACQVLAINTLGVLYIVESGDTVHSVEDLRGKTIYASGKGNTPEYALNYVLTQNGIDPAPM